MTLWQRILGVLYRERCLGCGEWGPRPVCEPCERAWPALPQPACRTCAEPLAAYMEECAVCLAAPRGFSGTVAAGAYVGVVRGMLQALKYRHRRDLASLLAKRLAEASDWPEGDWLLVPVPLHPRKQSERGYNQAALLAKALSRETGLRWRDALKRTTATRPQHGLDRSARLDNMEGAFRAKGDLAGQRVILVDDVLTTGATAQAAAQALLETGAAEVRVAVVARTMPPRYFKKLAP